LSPSVGSKRTRTSAPRRLAPLGKTELPGNECLRSPPIRASPDRLSARTRRNRKANLTIVPHPFREPQIEANPDPSARRTFDEKRTPRLDPFAASNRSKPRSFRRRTSLGSKLPASIRLQPGLEANLDPSAAGRRTRGEPLVLDPSRRQRGASPVSSPPDLPLKRERSNTQPVCDIGRRRTSCLLPPGHPPEGKPPNLDPSQPRSGASPALDRRTAWKPKSPHDPFSRTFKIEANPDPCSCRT
jgi:hypothetical protein